MTERTGAGDPRLAERLREARARLADPGPDSPDAHAGSLPRRPADAPIVASFEQERVWLVDRILGRAPEYNVPQCMWFRDEFDPDAFGRALTALVARHEVLRTVFTEVDGLPRPVLRPEGPVTIETVDGTELGDPADPDALRRLARRVADLADRPFDLAGEIPLRAAAVRCVDGSALVLLTVHHIATDGTAMARTWDELASGYAAARARRPLPADPPARQYADFAAWQRAHAAETEAADLRYWADRLTGLPELTLPTDHPRPAASERAGAEVRFTLPAATAARVRALSVRYGATPFMTLLAGFKAQLALLGGQTDIAVGTPVAGRDRPELETMLGTFVNTVVLRTELADSPSFVDLIGRVRESALGAYAHQGLPFAHLVEHLHPRRDLSRNPLFQVLFAHRHEPAPGAGTRSEPRLRPVPLPVTTSKFDLALTLTEAGPEAPITGSIVFDPDLFESATIHRLAAGYVRLLHAATAYPDLPPDRLPLADPAEAATLVHDWGRGEFRAPNGATLPELIAAQAVRTPEAIALGCGERTVTYAELIERADRLAARLAALGLPAEGVVAVCLDRSVDLVIALLGVLRAGGGYLPIDPSHATARIGALLADSETRLVLTHAATARTMPWADLGVPVLDLDTVADHAPGPRPPAAAPDPDQVAYLIHTSGSTGRPKGVMVTHGGVANLARDMIERLALDGSSVVGALTTVSFDIAVLELLVPLAAGARVQVLPQAALADGGRLGAALTDAGATVVQATPAGWAMLLDAGWPGGEIRALCGGEALPGPLAERIRARVARLWNVYGPTETTIWSAAHLVEHTPAPPGPDTPDPAAPPLGRPLLNTSLYVLDNRLAAVPIGVVGELYIGGLGLARGYAADPGRTAERLLPDPFAAGAGRAGARMYRTGDLVRYRPDGRLDFLGRADQQIKIRGHRIEPGEIEARLLAHPDIARAAVRVHGEGLDRVLVGYLVRRAGHDDRDPGVLAREWLRGSLPEYLVPPLIVELDALPLTPNGKLDRRALPDPPSPRTNAAHVAPVGERERRIAEVWARVLDVERVGAHDDFFALGGHSLRAARLVAALREELAVEAPVRLVFDRPTVRGFAAALDPERPVERIPRRAEPGPAPLSFLQRRLWFLDRLRPDRADYNVASVLRLRGRVDPALLRRAVEGVLARHDVLRGRFVSGPDGPVQVSDPVRPPWDEVYEPGAPDPGEAESAAFAEARRRCAEPFDLARGPLFRATPIRIAAEDHLLVVVVHHAVVDGWSLPLFWAEVGAGYRALAGSGSAAATPEPVRPPVQYADFAAWERADTTRGAADLHYWRAKLAGASATEIPADRRRPAMFDEEGASVDFELPETVARRTAEVARELGATPFVVLCAAFAVTAARLSGSADVVLGTPTAGRGRQYPELADVIGPFVNTLVLRTHAEEERVFADLVREVRTTVLDATAHQDLPFERLVEELRPERELNRHPLFRIMFALDRDEAGALDLPGVRTESVRIPHHSAKFDLGLTLTERRDGTLTGSLAYATALYHPTTAHGIADTFRRVLTAALAHPHRPVAGPELLDPAAARRLSPIDGPSEAEDGCLHTLIAARAAERPTAPALEFGEQVLTYARLDRRANDLARRLRAAGARPGVFVGVLLPRSIELVVGLLAVFRTGAAAVPLDPGQPARRNRLLLTSAGASLVLTDDASPTGDTTDRFAGSAVVSASTIEADNPPDSPAGPADLAYVTFTSGSTGLPKAVPTTHAAATRYLRLLAAEFGIGAEDTVLQVAAVSFDAAIRDIFGTLAAGARLVLSADEHARDPRAILATIDRRGVTALLSVVPSLLGVLTAVADGPGDADADAAPAASRLRLILLSGEEPNAQVLRRVRRLGTGIVVVNQYGPTECTMTSTFRRITDADLDAESIPIGAPLPGTRALVLDAAGRPLPTGAIGELYLGGPGVSIGYPGAPAATAERFLPDPYGPPGGRWYRTGDLARVDFHGRLIFHGRRDDQVKVRGVRVEPGEVEAALLARPEVRAAAVVAHRGPDGAELVAYVVGVTGPPDPRALRRALADVLPEHLRPGHYVALDALPTTAHGKLDRRALAARPPAPEPDSGEPVVTPRNRVEMRLLGVWEEVLGRAPIGVHQDFFELGGHSLKAVELVETIRRRTGLDLPLHTLFRNPTVERLAAAATARADPSPDGPDLVVPLGDEHLPGPPLFLVHPQSGDVCCYVHLVRELGNWRPVYGIEAIGYSSDTAPLTDLGAMARRYVEEVRKVAPDGPYLLAGWSFGGNVVVEMAALLEAAGEEVAFVGVIDARAFGEDEVEEWYANTGELARFGITQGLTRSGLSRADDDALLTLLTGHLTARDRLSRYADTGTLRRMIDVFTANGRAADGHRSTTRVHAPLHLFTASERHPTLTNPAVVPASWGRRTHASLHVVPVPGTHHDLANPPHVPEFARLLRNGVDTALRPDGAAGSASFHEEARP
ncbi:non-ribosomal peptide synthetase [Embleya hyalina]|uniref:Non-ribosomal peptide synthetase n=1 Tax=Embleya hyalina TaxID=516124 RepID=A0A401Z0B4_9ACTN|nr:non-ribosomal peptide synthetase [Embleya hyalina]GCE00305.1 non-ribosomal peptide synthetase [Embleya hyalina]